MSELKQLENTLSEVFVKNAPFQIPENGRKWIAQYAWIIGLVFVVLGGFSFIGLLGLLGLASVFATAVGVAPFIGIELLFAWLSLLVLGAEVVVGAFAVPKLKTMKKSGWNLTFWVALFSVIYGVVNAFARADILSLIMQLLFCVIGLYILFQVRSYFKN